MDFPPPCFHSRSHKHFVTQPYGDQSALRRRRGLFVAIMIMAVVVVMIMVMRHGGLAWGSVRGVVARRVTLIVIWFDGSLEIAGARKPRLKTLTNSATAGGNTL